MMRWDIINKFIAERNYLNYNELGYYKGWSFDNVNCQTKQAVDPYPCKTVEQEQWPYLTTLDNIAKCTSDEWFTGLGLGVKFDIYFIDSLHEASACYKDIKNALANLNEGGVIILHDMSPKEYKHTTTGDESGNWTGDAYKAFLRFRTENYIGFQEQYNCYVVNSDWGVGVIEKHNPAQGMKTLEKFYAKKEFLQKGIDDWEFFDQNRKELLNLISVEEFLKKFDKSSTTTISKTCNDGKPFDYPETDSSTTTPTYTARSYWENTDREDGTNKVEEIYGHLSQFKVNEVNDEEFVTKYNEALEHLKIPDTQEPAEVFLDKIQRYPGTSGTAFKAELPGANGMYIMGHDPYKKDDEGSLGAITVYHLINDEYIPVSSQAIVEPPINNSDGELKSREDGE